MATINKTLLIFVPTFPVRSETFIQREIVELSKVAQNYKVQVLSLRPGVGDNDTYPGVNVLYKRVTFINILLGLSDIRWLQIPKLLNISIRNKPRSLFGNLYLVLKAIGYAQIVKSLNTAHIHAHFLSESSTLMYYVAVLLDIPFSISAHARDVFATSNDITAIPELVVEKAEKAAFIVVCNKKAWEKCRELTGAQYENKVLLHYHGLNPNDLPAKTQNSSGNEPFNIVSVGRLVEKKGFTYLIDAAELLNKNGVLCHINIVGPGPLYQELTEKITAKRVGDTVSISGGGQGMPNAEVLKVMANADVFVLPSIETSEGDAEGIPNTLVEAAFLRLPIISTKSGSIEEFIHDGTSGLLVKQKSPEELAEAIKYLHQNPENAVQLADNVWEIANKSFNLVQNIKELDKLFSENLA